ncbi:MAG TPA: hypothetical protein PKW33_05720 [Anaerolineaceae bacterium]|nr:hypothetical protein [Anaerolineaceae bacterium]HPN51065.1 hypothetical protein [Anaerolineaceae bacterium]
MEKIQELLKNPIVTGVTGLVVGLFVGLVVLGWGLTPLQYKDAAPSNLQADYKADYLVMAVQAYSKDTNIALAKMRWEGLGKDAPTLLEGVRSAKKAQTADLEAFSVAVTGAVKPSTSATPAANATPAAGSEGGFSWLLIIIPVLCLVLIAIGVVGFLLFTSNKSKSQAPTASGESSQSAVPNVGAPTIPLARQAAEINRAAERTDFQAEGQENPVAQFMTTYMAGDDLYDDSFSIDSPAGEFLGECGVGISHTVGVGDPKKVTAFEVWLFDKNDIQTVTKVLMSPYAFEDAGIRQQLESKGEPVLAEGGQRLVLETATLQLEARVVDMSIGQGAAPDNSIFDRLTLELAVWPKAAAPAPEA